MSKVSIVVCVYNAEKTLDTCIKSIISQNFKDFDLIIVNDGSKDRSLDIINNYMVKDQRINCINQENLGPFLARENGCKIAKSDFIIFCDSDDVLLPNAIESLYNGISTKQVDLVIARKYDVVNNIKKDGNLHTKLLEKYGDSSFSLQDIDYALFRYNLTLCAKIFRKDILLKCMRDVGNASKNGEDAVVLFLYYLNSRKISFIYDYVYIYYQDTPNSLIKKSTSIIDVMSSWKAIFSLCNSYFDLPEQVNFLLVVKFLNVIKWLLTKNNYAILPKLHDFDFLNKFYTDYKSISEFKWISSKITTKKKLYRGIFRVVKNSKTKTFYLFDLKLFSFIRISHLKKAIKTELIRNTYEKKIRNLRLKEKISICFYVNQKQKWQSELLLNKFTSSNRFNISFVFNPTESSPDINDDFLFYESKGYPIYKAIDCSPKDFDIIFYQQPWCLTKEWRPSKAYKYSLLCYIPYCVYSLVSSFNCIDSFHPYLWKQFSDTSLDVSSRSNIMFLGSLKIEELHNHIMQKKSIRSISDIPHKRTIVYAPHHSLGYNSHRMSTWELMGGFILDFATKYSEQYNWVFRPHPRFRYEIIKLKILSEKEVDLYFDNWNRIGTVDEDSAWQDLLARTDILITDSISFLFDFAVTGKPLIHLLSLKQRDVFSDAIDHIIGGYYSVYTIEQLKNIFESLIINNIDTKKLIREKNIKSSDFFYSYSASDNIYYYLNNLLVK